MISKNSKDIYLDKEDDLKIFEKSNYRDRKEDIKDIIFASSDSNMKIFSRK